MAGGRFRGGICQLLDLIEEHRAALCYDWRTRFARGLDESVPADIGWDEALNLVRVLRSDPSSMLAASIEGWDHPFSRTDAILADVWDLEYAKAGAKKRETYPRPWPTKRAGDVQQMKGNTAGMTYAETVARLRALGHNVN